MGVMLFKPKKKIQIEIGSSCFLVIKVKRPLFSERVLPTVKKDFETRTYHFFILKKNDIEGESLLLKKVEGADALRGLDPDDTFIYRLINEEVSHEEL
jgi:hypothetical protein